LSVRFTTPLPLGIPETARQPPDLAAALSKHTRPADLKILARFRPEKGGVTVS